MRAKLTLTVLSASLLLPLAAAADGVQIAKATPGGTLKTGPDAGPAGKTAKVKLPQILKRGDVVRYRRIFALQNRYKWAAADREIRQLNDRTLLGHVYFQRYMSRRYRSRYAQLRGWMARYADHPEAKRIYKLALRRKPRRAAWPRRPVRVSLGGGVSVPTYTRYRPIPSPVLSRRDRRRAYWLRRSIRRHIARGRFTKAERYLKQARTKRLLGTARHDLMAARLAFQYMSQGNNDRAYALVSKAADRSGEYLPFAVWTAGLSAWRAGKYDEAAKRFEAIAQTDGTSSWVRSAGAYWAARTHLVNRKPELVNRWLDTAAQNARTFYGMLARRQLGLDNNFNWSVTSHEGADIDRVLEAAPAVRAMALIQVGQNARAERELWRLYRGGDTTVGAAMLAIAQKGNMPGLSLRVARLINRTNGQKLDQGLYPVPKWQPREGFTMDRAVVFAVMRQESAFRTRARSRVGASGLMQLMPRTASIVAGDRRLRWRRHRHRLYDPSFNISLGQRYLNQVLAMQHINGNLFYALAGYNAGPHRVTKWHREYDHRNDPLLFIETIPFAETRGYVEKVMANVWAYRERFGQKPVTLDLVAKGQWPIYKPQDGLRVSTNPGK